MGGKWLALFFVLSAFVAIGIVANKNASRRYHSIGGKAYRDGVPACANPYVGSDVTAAVDWLDGWVEESKK